MLKALKNIKPGKLLYFDIETRGQQEKLDHNSPLGDYMDYTFRNKADFKAFDSMEEAYLGRCGLYPEMGAICTISVGYLVGEHVRVTSFYGIDELHILQQFKHFLEAVSSKFEATCGFANKGFDTPFIIRRMLANGITDIPEILDESDAKPWEMKSVDLKDIFRLGSFNTPSLIGLATSIGVPSPKDGIEGSQVNKAFWDGRHEDIKDYCERDVVTVANCLLVAQGIPVRTIQSVEAPLYGEKEYPSFLDEFAHTGKVDMTELAKEGASLKTKAEKEMYKELVAIVTDGK